LDNSIHVSGLQEHLVELVDEVNVSDKTTGGAGLVPLNQLACLLFGKIYSKSANTGAESCFSNGSLSQLVEVDEELLDANSVFGDARLDALFNIVFVAEHCRGSLVARLMAVSRFAQILNVIAD